MRNLRSLILENRKFALVLLVLALCIKAAVPGGFMVSASGGVTFTVSICADASGEAKAMQLVVPGKQDPGKGHGDMADKGKPCAFSSLAKDVLGSTDAILLALAFAFILRLGLAPARRVPLLPFAHLRPPLRGPPAAA